MCSTRDLWSAGRRDIILLREDGGRGRRFWTSGGVLGEDAHGVEAGDAICAWYYCGQVFDEGAEGW